MRSTRKVAGLITLTVPSSLFGTYTRSGMPRTAGLNSPGSVCRYTFTAAVAGTAPSAHTPAAAIASMSSRPGTARA